MEKVRLEKHEVTEICECEDQRGREGVLDPWSDLVKA